MRASDLILYILQHRPLPTTKLVKLLYLVDLAWVQLTGKPLTNLPYIWHLRGPCCDEIEAALWDLEDERAVTVTSGTTQDGYAAQAISRGPANRPFRQSRKKRAIDTLRRAVHDNATRDS